MNQPPVSTHPHHVGIYCSDLNRSIEWWEKICGFKKMFENVFYLPNYKNGNARMAWLKLDDLYIELYDFPGLEPETDEQYWGTYGTKHICLYVADEDFDTYLKYLEDMEVTIWVKAEHPPEKLGKPTPTKVVFILDPDGNRVEIEQTFRPGEYS